MFWVGFLLIQATVGVCIMIGSSFTTFVNAPSLLLTFIGGQLAVWMVYGKQSVEVLTPSFAKNNPKQGIIHSGHGAARLCHGGLDRSVDRLDSNGCKP